jgi:hypothetical protein
MPRRPSVNTVVFQTFGGRVPEWAELCLASVRDWTASAAYDYRFIEFDDLLADAPSWLRERCGNSLIHPVLDYARVRRAQRLLDQGWDRAVWFDGDVLVLQPERLRLPNGGAAFMAETWTLWEDGALLVKQRLTNCICQFVAGDHFTDHYLEMMTSVGQTSSPLSKAALGTELLTGLDVAERPAVIPNIGNLSPHALAAIASGDGARVAALVQATGEPLYAVNVCASHEGSDYRGVRNTEAVYATAVARLRSKPQLLAASGTGT